jgi:hypothetical protein
MFLIGTNAPKVQSKLGNWRNFLESFLATLSQKETDCGVGFAPMWHLGALKPAQLGPSGQFLPAIAAEMPPMASRPVRRAGGN